MDNRYHYTVYKIEMDGSLSNKEHLNADELDNWMLLAINYFATIKVVRSDGRFIIYDDNGDKWTIRERSFSTLYGTAKLS